MSDLSENGVRCQGGMHVLGHSCPVCGVVTIPARFWPKNEKGEVAQTPEEVQRDYPKALDAYASWHHIERTNEPFAPTPLAYAAGRIRA